MTNLLTRPPVDQETRHDRLHRPLLLCAAGMAVLAVVSGIGMMVDGRTLLGEPVWFKPFKFAVSFGLYAATLAWMLGRLQRWRRTLWWLATVAVLGFLTPEIAVITFQAVRGVRSHFNFSTPLDATLFAAMGGAAYLGWLMTFAIGALLLFQRRLDKAMAWAVPLGIALSLAGMSVGYLMTSPTPDQAEALNNGLKLATIGAHSVGGLDGGATMPLTGWATGTGDLRVAHFVGLHALQALPLIAIGLRLLARRLPTLHAEATRAALVIVAALGYAGLTGLLLWQAQRGQALTQPDSLTLTAAGVLLAAVAASTTIILAVQRARRSHDRA
ncbi:hypothetical protein [Microtetraspora malaysiensis]|uniref:hypothetical protein n=1 Tax=Microtetraspora malaysiensis TaxID=161358 RepID=UPI000831A79A|nr:hypothetical protein [Microtetraspora malaysiensis]